MPAKYAQIREILLNDINRMNPIIQIIDELRSSGEVATKEQLKQLNAFEIYHSKEVIALMLENKAQKRNLKYPNAEEYNPFLLSDDDDIKNFHNYLAGLPENHRLHYDIILRPQDVHSTPLQIDSDGSKVRMFFIDTLSDTNKSERYDIEEALGTVESHSYTQGKILNSNFGCSIFSIQHLNFMNTSNRNNNDSYLKQGENLITDIDPALLKHMQSLNAANEIQNKRKDEDLFVNKKHDKTLKQHIDDYTITVETSDNTGNITRKKRNISILYKTHKYIQGALETLDKLYKKGGEQSLEETFHSRNGRDILNQVYQDMGLTEEQTNKVQGLFNREQITLALEYNIDIKELKESSCFQNHYMSKYIFNLIKDIYESSKEAEKITQANKLFSSLKKISTAYQLYAINTLKIDPLKVQKSKFLTDRNIAPYVIETIQHWHDKYGKKSAGIIFNIIHRSNKISISELQKIKDTNINDILLYKIFQKDIKDIDLLLDMGADINYKNKYNVTPLAQGLNSMDEKLITHIISSGAKLRKEDIEKYKDLFTPKKLTHYFKSAIDKDNLIAVKNLIEYDPSLFQKKIDEISPLEYAHKNNKIKLLNAMIHYLPKKSNYSDELSENKAPSNILPTRKFGKDITNSKSSTQKIYR
jgi:hypothetical protein